MFTSAWGRRLHEPGAFEFGPIRAGVRADLEPYLAFAGGIAEAPHWPTEAWKSFLLPEDTGDAIRRRIFAVRFGGHDQTEIAGLIAVALTGPITELELLLVVASARRRGLGTGLLEHWLQWARESGAAEAFLEVRASNFSAQNLYQKLGFQSQGIRARYYHQPVEDALLMHRELP